MARYRFHATNGSAFVFDTVGKDVRSTERLTRRAAEVAESVMGRLNDRKDWSEWCVSVHDLNGQRVLVQPFVARTDSMAQAA